MSFLKTIDTGPSFAPRESGPLPERLISGDPTFKTRAQDAAREETIKTGVWEATPGETCSIKGESFEFCHILSGVVEITPDGGEPLVYKAGVDRSYEAPHLRGRDGRHDGLQMHTQGW